MRARFITLDGIDGAGKSTHIAFMQKWFAHKNIPVLFTREPGGTPVGEALRSLLLDPQTKASLNTETLMMFAARMQHLEEVIYPALKQGIWVVSDRFTDATFAYQGGGRGVPMERIAQLATWVQQGFEPDLTFVFDVPLSVAQQRIEKTRDKDRFEQEESAFFERVREVYLERASHNPERFRILDSAAEIESIQHIIGDNLQALLEQSV